MNDYSPISAIHTRFTEAPLSSDDHTSSYTYIPQTRAGIDLVNHGCTRTDSGRATEGA